METPFYLCVPAAKHIVVSGDIHGDLIQLAHDVVAGILHCNELSHIKARSKQSCFGWCIRICIE